MYKLETKRKNLLEETENQKSKESHNVYLRKEQWKFLDDLACHNDMSRNKALRELLDQVMGGY